MALTKTQISELYVSIFNRASEKSGSQNWLNSGYNTDATTMANAMLATDAAKTYFGTSLDSNAAFVEHIYANTLNKGGADVDAAGKAGWVEFLETGKSRGEMVAKMIEAIKEYQVGGSKYATANQATKDAAQQFANRVEVSDYTADTLETIAVSEIDSTLSFGGALIVTANPTTVTTAKNSVQALTIDGKTFTLTTGVDTITGTEFNDLIIGVTSSLSSEKTLSPTDNIDGGAGSDTAKFSMKADFTGFTGTNTMKNVETVELTNDSTIARTFDATGVSGVEKYKIDATKADVKLKDLDAAGITIDYSGAKAKEINVAFDTAFTALNGTADAMTLNVNGLGIDEAAKTATKAAVALDALEVKMAGIEELTINSNTNASVLDLAGVTAAKTITLAGAADTKITAVAGTVTTVDGTTATGKLNLDLTAATALNNVATGSADDIIKINAATLIANAQINGGAGEDTLVVTNASGAAKTLQLSMSDVEKVSVGALVVSNDVLLSNTNTSGLSTVDVTGALAAKLSLVNLAGADMTVNGKAAVAASTGEVYLDNSGATTVNLSATAADITDKKATTNDLDITAANTASLVVNVGEYVDSSSVISAEKATSVTVNVASGKDKTTPTPAEITKFDGKINAAKAETITVNATGIIAGTINAAAATSANITTTAASSLVLDAEKLESLTVTAGANLNFAGSDLTAVQTLEANTAGALNLTALNKVSTASITGTATNSAATIVSIGNASLGYDTTLSATGLKAGLTVSGAIISGTGANTTLNVGTVTGVVNFAGALTAGSTLTVEADGLAGDLKLAGTLTGTDVVVNAKTALGNVSTTGAAAATGTAVVIAAKDSLIYNGTDLKANFTKTTIDATSTKFNATLNGGIEADTHEITMGAAQTSVTVTGDLGLGVNKVEVKGVASPSATALTVDVSALKNSTTTIDLTADTAHITNYTVVGSDGVDTIKMDAGAPTVTNTITAGKGADIITLGVTGSKDTIVINAGDTGKTLLTADKITGFVTTQDSLKLGVAGTATNYTSGVALKAVADAAANTAFDGTVMYFLASTGGTTAADSALYIDRDLDGTFDEIIELTGTLAANFAATDIVA